MLYDTKGSGTVFRSEDGDFDREMRLRKLPTSVPVEVLLTSIIERSGAGDFERDKRPRSNPPPTAARSELGDLEREALAFLSSDCDA